MQLLGDLVLVLPDYGSPEQTIALPDWQRSLEGFVIQCGPDCKEVQAGDRVLYGAASGMSTYKNGAEHRIMREDDITCVVEA